MIDTLTHEVRHSWQYKNRVIERFDFSKLKKSSEFRTSKKESLLIQTIKY